jgi:phospholipid/cholesterol/gamma-HCH transport system substrate-binding protein
VNTETKVGLFIILGMTFFLSLSIYIGDIKFNKNEYSEYLAYFDETGGLETKSPIKIAGVTVGWVDKVSLLEGGKAEIIMRVKSIHKLGKNAFVRISQEGLIGAKTIEIDPGESSSGYLTPGSTLPMPGRAPTTVSGLLENFKDITSSVGDLTSGLKNSFATVQAEKKINETLSNTHQTSAHIEQLTSNANKLIKDEKENISKSIQNIQKITSTLKKSIGKNANDAILSAKGILQETDEIIEKINNGKGFVGKLINEEQLYNDLQKTVSGVKNYVQKTQNIHINLDGHLESMLDKSDRKGYVNLNIFTYSDYFYTVGMTSGKVGKFERETLLTKYFDNEGVEIKLPTVAELPNYSSRDPFTLAKNAPRTQRIKATPSKPMMNLQVGKKFSNLTVRAGLFEDNFGIGLDYTMPFDSTDFSWITTLEAFDFHGHNRLNGDDRMHIKWLNRLFLMKSIYAVFGIDDLVGRTTATPFVGIGISFNDDDLKYVLPSFASLK